MRKTIAPGVVIVLMLFAVSTGAPQVSLTPRIMQMDRLTCADLVAQKGEAQNRLLIYLNGYVNGARGRKVWDEKVEGERIDVAVKECKAAPTKLALEVFTALWSR